MSQTSGRNRVERDARLKWEPIALMRVSPLAQRDLSQPRVDYLVANFDPEQIGTPTVNHRDGGMFVIDGQHRVEALRAMEWGDQQIQCWVYEGLTEKEEAEKFLQLNDTLTVSAFSKFRVGVRAGRADECAIDAVVQKVGLCVSQAHVSGAISAVGTLRRVYSRSDAATLSRTLSIVRDAYGDSGLEAAVIDGIGLVCQRYDGQLDVPIAVEQLAKVRGGVNGLLGDAEKVRDRTGNQKAHCVAAAAVTIINRRRAGKKLPSWWAKNEGD